MPIRVTPVTKIGPGWDDRRRSSTRAIPASSRPVVASPASAARILLLAQGMLLNIRDRPLAASALEDEAMPTTLLDLVQIVSKYCKTEDEIVAVVRHLVNTRRVRLIGSYRDCVFA